MVRPPYEASEIKHEIARMDWFVGTRMHATIAALSTGVPAGEVAHSPKFRGISERCDLADACPVTPLYWSFLERHRAALAENPRLALPLASAARRAPEARAADARVFEAVSATLGAGGQLSPGYCG